MAVLAYMIMPAYREPLVSRRCRCKPLTDFAHTTYTLTIPRQPGRAGHRHAVCAQATAPGHKQSTAQATARPWPSWLTTQANGQGNRAQGDRTLDTEMQMENDEPKQQEATSPTGALHLGAKVSLRTIRRPVGGTHNQTQSH